MQSIHPLPAEPDMQDADRPEGDKGSRNTAKATLGGKWALSRVSKLFLPPRLLSDRTSESPSRVLQSVWEQLKDEWLHMVRVERTCLAHKTITRI